MNFIIKCQGPDGKWVPKDTNLKEKAFWFFNEIMEDGRYYIPSRWEWLRDKLAQWCLRNAEESGNDIADKWIARYRAIRSIE